MKKFVAFVFSVVLMLGLASTSAFADPVKGQKYYLKYMKDSVGTKGDKFAHEHTQAEWEALFEGNAEKFVKEYSEKYPNLKEFLDSDKFLKFMPHIKDFCIEYAIDSGKVPSC